MVKSNKQLERYFKGAANHHRIAILLLLAKTDSLSLDSVAQTLNMNFKTASEHTRRLVQAGLINKNYYGRVVLHSLSPYGKEFVKFMKTF